jgi:hypothetical protein
MPELRLVDPDGYTVPGTAQNVPDADVDKVRHQLLTETAPQHAAQWQDFGYDARSYRVIPRDTQTVSDGPTSDYRVAVARFIALIDEQPRGRVSASKGRYLARQAVYGNLWTPERVGDVLPEDRPTLRAIVSRINRLVFPGGALAASVTVSDARLLLDDGQ